MSAEAHTAAIVSVGDELLAGAHPDLNAPHLAARLVEWGRQAHHVGIVRDDEEDIAAAVVAAAERAPLVLVSGGLGPTLDDVTRHGVARAAGVAIEHSEEAWGQICAWYARSSRPMPESNRRQALLPAGARVLANLCGTAPGIHCQVGDADVFVLPGPPPELADMFAHAVAPWLDAHPISDGVFASRSIHLSDLSESVFADGAGEWMARDANPRMGCTVKQGILTAKLVAHAPTRAAVEALLEQRLVEFRERFGAYVFSETSPDLALALGAELLASGLSITLAESCTGGLIAAALTAVPGISAVLRETVVTYSDEAKIARLGVPKEVLASHGAVSAETAAAMAMGAAQRAGARLALSVTGIAGPGGGSAERPVGLVWFGVACDGDVQTHQHQWPDAGRDRVRAWAAVKGLRLLLQAAREARKT
ncbi:MAG: CinA family nicotinamide mononucleotide deamidase-related protein [Planctomycetota bacterium]|nr:CinA family nicotinamide mononucleotide deamidase-related protein [Planctomycetota bacterium]